jgi:type IV pilus assembly protein PilB
MSNVPEFLASVRLQVPAQTQLINARAELLQDDPMRLLKDLMDKSILPKARLCQLWADSLGVAYVSPMTVAIPTDSYEQLPVEVARRAQAIALNSIGDTVTVAMVEPLNTRQIESLGKILGKNISPVFSHPEEISTVIDMYLGQEGNIAANLLTVCEQLGCDLWRTAPWLGGVAIQK